MGPKDKKCIWNERMDPGKNRKNTKISATCLLKWRLRATEDSSIHTLTPETKLQAPRSNVKHFRRRLKFSRDALWVKSNQKMQCGYQISKISSVRHGLLSYKEWFTPPIKRVAGNRELLLPKCEASFHAHSLERGAVLSTHQLLTMILPGCLKAADSNVTKKSSK